MILRCLAPFTMRFSAKRVALEPGMVFIVTPTQAARVLERFPTQLEVLSLPAPPPIEPLQPSWRVAWRDRDGRLLDATVQGCEWVGSGWFVRLTNGQSLPLALIRSVGQTDEGGPDRGRLDGARTRA